MYDQRLLRKINQGRAFALVGSGPSTELYYPSWAKLAEDSVAELARLGRLSDVQAYKKYISDRRYPELFSQAERDMGGREALVEMLAKLLVRGSNEPGFTYDILTNWPFSCYLTTNWDDEIHRHLRLKNVFFSTLRNSKAEFSNIRHDASRLIVKLHSDLAHPQDAVITSADYDRLMGTDHRYFQDKLKAIFEMFDVLVVGHSLSDPDLQLVLRVAKEAASPEHPVFLIAADLTFAEIREYLERFNIVALTYENKDGKHFQLRRRLSLLDRFVIPRRKRIDANVAPYSAEELEAAQAVATYRRLAIISETEVTPVTYIGPLVLRALHSRGTALTLEELLATSPLSLAATNAGVRNQVPSILQTLKERTLVTCQDERHGLTDEGKNQVNEIIARRETDEAQAFGQFSVELQTRFEQSTPEQRDKRCRLLQETLVRVFRQRGLSIANAVFAGQTLSPNALSDLFSAIADAATTIPETDEAIAFMEASHEFLLKPNDPQRRYLASLSQGYFLYHLFGLDPTCAKIRRAVFEHTIWWCDSSTLIPLLAAGSANHEYAVDLFARTRNLKAFTVTTGRLVREISEHLTWAIRLLERENSQSPAVLEAATEKGGYKQNLFLDGYIRLSAEGKVGTFREYLSLVAPTGQTDNGIRAALARFGVSVIDADQLRGFQTSDTREMFELAYEIKEAREQSATFRSGFQVEAEAEILYVIRRLKDGSYKPPFENMEMERSYFLSQSRILDRIPPIEPITWSPEVLYRYILALPGETLDPDLLQRCMLQEYFGAGVVVVDEARYAKFFGPSIDVANTTYREERDKYLKEFTSASPGELDQAFDATPDLEKPFFVQQMGWRVAAKESAKAEVALSKAKQTAVELEKREMQLTELRLQRDADWKRRKSIREKQLAAEQRNAHDPRHQRKRQKQAKKKKKK